MPRLGFGPRSWALFGLVLSLLLTACAGPPARQARLPAAPQPRAQQVQPAPAPQPRPQMVAAQRPMQCVTYARHLSGLPIRGDAWTWWRAAEGRYTRNRIPRPGAVLVLERTGRLAYGHLAVVTRVLGPRRILVDHANWLNRGRIHRNAPVVDVSPGNDWSLVRVWYIPGDTLGVSRYPAYGFIHPEALTTASTAAP